MILLGMDFLLPLCIWDCLPIFLTPPLPTAEFETRCSQGRKVILYKKAKLEKWAPYFNGNGLVKRLTIYADSNCKRMEFISPSPPELVTLVPVDKEECLFMI